MAMATSSTVVLVLGSNHCLAFQDLTLWCLHIPLHVLVDFISLVLWFPPTIENTFGTLSDVGLNVETCPYEIIPENMPAPTLA